MIFETKDGTLGIAVGGFLYDMHVKQDLELFILTIRNTRDTSTINEITSENYNLVGVSEFTRFTALEVLVDTDTIETTNPQFYLDGLVTDDYMQLHFYFTRSSNYYRTPLKISRNGRVEKVSVNEVNEFIFEQENQSNTWYGHDYTCSFLIKSGTSSRLNQGNRPNFCQVLKPIQSEGKYDAVEIPSLGVDDVDYVKQHKTNACVFCARI